MRALGRARSMDLLRKFGSTGLIFRSKVRTNGGKPSTNWSIIVIWIGMKGKIKIHSDRLVSTGDTDNCEQERIDGLYQENRGDVGNVIDHPTTFKENLRNIIKV